MSVVARFNLATENGITVDDVADYEGQHDHGTPEHEAERLRLGSRFPERNLGRDGVGVKGRDAFIDSLTIPNSLIPKALTIIYELIIMGANNNAFVLFILFFLPEMYFCQKFFY